MSSVIVFIVVAFLLYQLVFKLIIPIYRTTKHVKRSIREMQEKMQGHAQQPNGYNPINEDEKKGDKIKGDYIDFEEVR